VAAACRRISELAECGSGPTILSSCVRYVILDDCIAILTYTEVHASNGILHASNAAA